MSLLKTIWVNEQFVFKYNYKDRYDSILRTILLLVYNITYQFDYFYVYED